MSEDHFTDSKPDCFESLMHLATDQAENLIAVLKIIPISSMLKYEERRQITEARKQIDCLFRDILQPRCYPIRAGISPLKSGDSFADECGNNTGART